MRKLLDIVSIKCGTRTWSGDYRDRHGGRADPLEDSLKWRRALELKLSGSTFGIRVLIREDSITGEGIAIEPVIVHEADDRSGCPCRRQPDQVDSLRQQRRIARRSVDLTGCGHLNRLVHGQIEGRDGGSADSYTEAEFADKGIAYEPATESSLEGARGGGEIGGIGQACDIGVARSVERYAMASSPSLPPR